MPVEIVFAYAAPMALVWAIYFGVRRKFELRSTAKLATAKEGLEPASLHPVIDPLRCIGCGSCMRACPEGKILGLINGKAELIVQDAAAYQKLRLVAEEARVLEGIRRGIEDMHAGRTMSLDEFKNHARTKHGIKA